jgi:hypothetical protein
MKQHFFAVAIASSLLAMTGVHAVTQDEYNAARDRIASDFKASATRCATWKDDARDICMKKARGAESVARAELELQFNPNPANARKAALEKATAAYEVAVGQCDDRSANARDACVIQAKVDRDRALAELKDMKG